MPRTTGDSAKIVDLEGAVEDFAGCLAHSHALADVATMQHIDGDKAAELMPLWAGIPLQLLQNGIALRRAEQAIEDDVAFPFPACAQVIGRNRETGAGIRPPEPEQTSQLG